MSPWRPGYVCSKQSVSGANVSGFGLEAHFRLRSMAGRQQLGLWLAFSAEKGEDREDYSRFTDS